MKIRWMIGAVVLAMTVAVPAQAQFFADNFDAYASGSGIIGQGGWEGWDASPAADAMVVSTYSYSSPNSLAVSGAADVVHQFVGVSAGTWYAKVWTYVPSNQTGNLYFIILDTYNHGGPYNWAVQLRMSAADGVIENQGGSQVPGGGTAALLTDQWVEVVVEINFAANLYTVTYGGSFVDIQQYADTGNGGSLNVGAYDLFSDASTESYMDNVWLDTSIPVELQSFDIE